jgi:NAD(P)-dependent dehydrogenase (short-subunit alcohol dehydrogenase family)
VSTASPEQRSALVTGASTGIGEACAKRLDRLGFRVFAGVRDEDAAERLRAAGSASLTPITIDVTDSGSISAAAEQVAGETGGTLDALVNNAGIAVTSPAETVPLDRLRAQLEVNLVGQIAVTQEFLPMLRKAKGRIVNVSSVGGKVALPFVGPYAASKFGLEAFSDSMRRELRDTGVQVVVVEPGAVATPIWSKGTAEADQRIAELSPEHQAVYGTGMEQIRKASVRESERGLDPAKIADVVAHALTARKPKTRYPIGRGVRARIVLSKLLPDRVFDSLVARTLARI